MLSLLLISLGFEGFARRYGTFGGVRWLLVGEDDPGMENTREFWLRLGVIGGALILMISAIAAFFG